MDTTLVVNLCKLKYSINVGRGKILVILKRGSVCALGWSDFNFFAIFDNGLSIGYIFMSSIPNIGKFCCVCARGVSTAKFSFSKNQRDLKREYLFGKVCRNLPFTSKNN